MLEKKREREREKWMNLQQMQNLAALKELFDKNAGFQILGDLF